MASNIAGCSSAKHEDDDHLEHHFPAHKPASFAAAIDQVRDRFHRIATEFETMEPDRLQSELTELRDIIGWLPEQAADSDMKKAAWDQVHEASNKLAVTVQDAIAASAISPRSHWPGDRSRTESLIETLARQIPPGDDKQ